MPVNEVHKLIHAIDNEKTGFYSHSLFVSDKLRELINIEEYKSIKQQIKNENNQLNQQIKNENNQLKEQIKNENNQLKQQITDETNQLKQQIKEMQELLNSFVNSKIGEISK